MLWEEIIGHDEVKRVLERSLVHPAPGYVFCGPSGIGKSTLARGFVRGLLEYPSGKSLDLHPDFLTLKRDPDTKQIGADAIRELVTQMYLSPALGKRRIALIQEADLLNATASNALLKAVEEPKANNIYLFTATSYGRMPHTLQSRLVRLQLHPCSSAEMSKWLVGLGYAKEQVEDSVPLAGGCPGRVKRILAEPELWQTRKQLAEELLTACNKTMGARLELLQRMKKTIEQETDPIEAWKACVHLAMRLARSRIPDPERFAEVAQGLILSWHFIGGSVSPEVGLEWTGVRTSFINELRYLPSFLYPMYL